MSTVVTSNQRATRPNDPSEDSATSTVAYRSADGGHGQTRPISKDLPDASSPRATKFKGFNVQRRLKGFVTKVTGDTWEVVFVKDQRPVPYKLPAKKLREVGITAINQPFEMDELVPEMPGAAGKVYVLRPLAHLDDAIEDTLTLDSSRQDKLDLILAKLG